MQDGFSVAEAGELVKLARKSISYTMTCGRVYREASPEKFACKRGIFVTLETYPEGELRGCIGFPEPVMELWQGVIEGARSAAFSDPRFPVLGSDEVDKVIVEISILTVPEEITGEGGTEKILEEVKVGRDGLIVSRGHNSGLLLPQVAPRFKWSVEEFLEQTCVKAGLRKDAWKEPDTKIMKFRSQVFREEKPNGKVVEVEE